jgi:uncharacterized protein YdiU (UPF0061 family)
MSTIETLPLEHGFAQLPSAFYTFLPPTPLPNPTLVAASIHAAQLIGLPLAELNRPEFATAMIGNTLPERAKPLAAVYSGHQFGVWAGQLGDGRALLLGDVTHGKARWELQLKGAGQTPYSRMGDGRAVLRSSIREFLCSEAMAALHIPTSRALSIVSSPQHVMREQPEPCAVVTRMAPSFVRFGSFEHWYHRNQHAELKILADYVIDQFYPELRWNTLPNSSLPYFKLVQEVTNRTAELVAHWQAVGFMHGVLNTDNMSVLGLTLDYGPFGFMEAFDRDHICNHTDQNGRYSYAMQPKIGQWNCFAFAQCLLPLIGDVDSTQAALADYEAVFSEKWGSLMQAKLGLRTSGEHDADLIEALLDLMQKNHADYTLFFRRLCDLQIDHPEHDAPLRDLFLEPAAFDAWASDYRQRLQQEHSQDGARQLTMRACNPKYILRNYLAQQAIEKAHFGDFSEVQQLLKLLEHPFDEQPELAHYAALPPDWANGLEVSCSS